MPPALVPGILSQLWGFPVAWEGSWVQEFPWRLGSAQSPGASQEGRGESWDGGQNILKSAWQGWDIFIDISIFRVGGDIPHG